MNEKYKPGRKANVRTQKMTSFRLDTELLDWLAKQPNKGRYINQLIKNDMVEKGG